ncbi:MAG: hypothetical protein ABSF91_12340 [Bacteroidota bacterium]
MRTIASILLGLLLGICSYGCSYAGYCIGNSIDNRSEQKVVLHRTLTNDSIQIAIAAIPLKREIDVHLINGNTFSGTFAGINPTRDSLFFHAYGGTRNVPTSDIDYIAKKNFRAATKIGLVVGISLDIAAIIEVAQIIVGPPGYYPTGW